ncbi:cyclin-dependent kinase C-2-like isoform X2 [Hibiscus syriacus]|uniref:cyclin-dependent kinase C-2-like isoform X2 n=1 Tax=Hibiscus syriacus TaxID=106335 RepID=UPI001924BBE6|nr:cyclin-dependent kinase C-2-like isoform X2 [Hibiscus syriacus]
MANHYSLSSHFRFVMARIYTLLAIDPAERLTATAALRSEFFTTKPYACEPSSLPNIHSVKRWMQNGEMMKHEDSELQVKPLVVVQGKHGHVIEQGQFLLQKPTQSFSLMSTETCECKEQK